MPYEPNNRGMKYDVHVEDLTGRDVVVFTCPNCHAQFNVAPHSLYARYHPLRRLTDIKQDFHCKRCGHRGEGKWYVMRAVGPEFPRVA